MRVRESAIYRKESITLAEFIYQMIKARKAHGDKVILDDVTLAFYPGAKIGVVGPNGAGKSTVMKIMAGLDTPSNGEARLATDATVGILLQEPPLDESLTVLGNVELAVKETKAKLDRFNEISALMAEPDADFDALLAEMGVLQEQIDHLDAWDLDSQLEQAMDALRCPPGDADVKVLSGGEKRRVALCKLLLEAPDLLLLDELRDVGDVVDAAVGAGARVAAGAVALERVAQEQVGGVARVARLGGGDRAAGPGAPASGRTGGRGR